MYNWKAVDHPSPISNSISPCNPTGMNQWAETGRRVCHWLAGTKGSAATQGRTLTMLPDGAVESMTPRASTMLMGPPELGTVGRLMS